MFSPENEDIADWKRNESNDMQQFEELRQKYHELNIKYQSKVSIEKDNLTEIEELRSCLENEKEERKKESLKYEEENRKKEIHWKNEVEQIKAENEDALKMYKDRIENLEEELDAVKNALGKERSRAAEIKGQMDLLTEAIESEVNKVKEVEVAQITLQKECYELKEKLATAEERLMIKEEEVEKLKEKLENAFEEAALYSSQMQEMKALQKEDEPADPHAKGNSLFAEVDDRRQRMKHQLLLEKRKITKLQHAYQSKCGRVKHLEEELIHMSRKWKDDLQETATSKENLIASYKSHIKDLEDKLKRLQNEGFVVDGNFMRGKITSPIEELKRIELEMEKTRKEADELREKLTSASLERLLRDQDLCDLKGELRRLRAENAYLRKMYERSNSRAAEEVPGMVRNDDCPSSASVTDTCIIQGTYSLITIKAGFEPDL